MGPLIWQTKKGETMFSIRAILFGGYVAMAGEEVEFDALKDVKNVKVIIDNDRITKIIINLDNPKGMWFYCVSDNLRKGAASNAIQILKNLILKDQ